MRSVTRSIAIILVLLAGWAAPPRLAQAASLDTTADRVIGQPDFTSGDPNSGGLGATSLYFPQGAVLDAQGNLYVADEANNRVLVYDAPLTTHAAASRVIGQPNVFTNTVNNGGVVTAASLYAPLGVALDAQGNLYVADANNNRVLEYDAPLTTGMAANRVFGQGGSFTTAAANKGGLSASSLNGPWGVALDAQGNLYVADRSNHRLLEYDTPLTTDTTADRVFGQGGDFTHNTVNNGGVTADSLASPFGAALDAQGNLYVADGNNNRVLEYDVPVPYGVPAVAALSPSSVAAGSPAFTLTVNGAGYVPGSVVRWNGSDRPTAFLSSTQLNASLSAGDIAGAGPFAVTVFTPAPGGGTSSLLNLTLYTRVGHDATADVVQGQPNFASSNINNPLLPAANRLKHAGSALVDPHSGRLFVADVGNHRVLSWPNAPAFANAQPADLVLGQPNFLARGSNDGGLSRTSLSSPTQLALDAQGNLYVADFANNRVLVYNAPLSSGMAASRVFGQGGSFTTALANNGGVSANSLDAPAGLALDAQGRLYVADEFNNRVLEYDTPLSGSPTAARVFGQPDFNHDTFNTGGLSASTLSAPIGLALDGQGNQYVADFANNRVLVYDAPLSSAMAASRVFGQGGSFTTNSLNKGGLSATSLYGPGSVALDGWGNLYVADYYNNRVLEYDQSLTTNRTADRVFGQPDFISGIANNGGISATSLDGAYTAALDGQSNLYVADAGNSRLLEYDWASAKVYLPLVRH